MKKLRLVITDRIGGRNIVLSNFKEEVSQQFAAEIIYSGLPKSAYQCWAPSYLAKEQ